MRPQSPNVLSRLVPSLEGQMTGTVSRAALIAVLLTLLVAVPIASAAVVLSDDRTTIRADETVAEDAYIFGDSATINGTVEFDVVAATNTFDLGETGRIGGNVNVAANDVRLRGPIERSVRVAAREVVITSSVGGDFVIAAQTVRIESGATISGDLRVAAQDVIVAGAVNGDIVGNAGMVDLTGATIGGNVDIDVNELTIDGTTTVAGDVRYESEDTATIGDDATVSGVIERSTPSSFSNGNVSLTGDTTWSLGRLLAMLITGIALVLAIPAATAAAADGARKRLARSAITGFVALILIPVVAFFLLVTVIGIPVSLILLVLFGIALYVSQVVVGLAIGRWILPRSWRGTGRGFNLLAMVLGVVLISLVRLIPLPFVDGLVALIVAVVGLGAILVAIHSARRSPAAPAPAYWSGPSYGPATQG